jgi:hypothetical protein
MDHLGAGIPSIFVRLNFEKIADRDRAKLTSRMTIKVRKFLSACGAVEPERPTRGSTIQTNRAANPERTASVEPVLDRLNQVSCGVFSLII